MKRLLLGFVSFLLLFAVACENSGSSKKDQEATADDSAATDTDSVSASCGNGTVDGSEICDGDVKDCVDIDAVAYNGGKAMCKADCSGYQTATCEEVPHTCGNDIKEGPEVCDGDVVDCSTVDAKYTAGKAMCKEDCTGYNILTCTEGEPAVCGDGVVEGAEVCEKDAVKDCVEIDSGYTGGKAMCKADCSGWETATCEGTVGPDCGNNVIENGEQCDGDAKDCSEIELKLQGVAACKSDCSGYDTASCTEKPHWTTSDHINTDNWTGLMWTSDAVNWLTEGYDYHFAASECEKQTLGGFTDWRMPTISELRTLIIFCEAKAGGACTVTDECNTNECTGDRTNCHTGECTLDMTVSWTGVAASVLVWSSTPKPDEEIPTRWVVDFFDGLRYVSETFYNVAIMCVREVE